MEPGYCLYLPILTMVVLQASQMEKVTVMSRLAGSLFRARIVRPFSFQYVYSSLVKGTVQNQAT